VAWHIIVKKRHENYLKLLLGTSRKWNIEESVDEYMKPLNSSKKDRTT
jgi:hypothetical protein